MKNFYNIARPHTQDCQAGTQRSKHPAPQKHQRWKKFNRFSDLNRSKEFVVLCEKNEDIIMEHPGTPDLDPVILRLPLQLDDVDGDVVDVPAGADGPDTPTVVLRLQDWPHPREFLQSKYQSIVSTTKKQ